MDSLISFAKTWPLNLKTSGACYIILSLAFQLYKVMAQQPHRTRVFYSASSSQLKRLNNFSENQPSKSPRTPNHPRSSPAQTRKSATNQDSITPTSRRQSTGAGPSDEPSPREMMRKLTTMTELLEKQNELLAVHGEKLETLTSRVDEVSNTVTEMKEQEVFCTKREPAGPEISVSIIRYLVP